MQWVKKKCDELFQAICNYVIITCGGYTRKEVSVIRATLVADAVDACERARKLYRRVDTLEQDRDFNLSRFNEAANRVDELAGQVKCLSADNAELKKQLEHARDMLCRDGHDLRKVMQHLDNAERGIQALYMRKVGA